MIEVRNLGHSLGGKQILENVSFTLKEGSVMGLVGINGAGKSLCQMYRVFYPDMDMAIFRKYMAEFGLDEKKPIRSFSKGMRRQLYVALALSVRPKYLLLDEAFDGLDPLARLAFKKAVNCAVEEDGTAVLIASHSLRELEDFCDSYILLDNKTVAGAGDLSQQVNRYCKFQLAFTEECPDVLFEGLPVASMEKNGRFIRLILEGESELMRKKLEALRPAVLEEMPMDFEEMFIHEVREKGYDI